MNVAYLGDKGNYPKLCKGKLMILGDKAKVELSFYRNQGTNLDKKYHLFTSRIMLPKKASILNIELKDTTQNSSQLCLVLDKDTMEKYIPQFTLPIKSDKLQVHNVPSKKKHLEKTLSLTI